MSAGTSLFATRTRCWSPPRPVRVSTSCGCESPTRSGSDSSRSSCSYPLTEVSVLVNFTKSLVTSSAKIARTGYSFARGFLPDSPIGFPTSRSTETEIDPDAAYAPVGTEPTTDGNRDPLEAFADEADPEIALSRDADVEGDVEGTGRTFAATSPPRSTLAGEMEELRFIKLSDKATLPTRAHDNDAGLDLYAAEGARIVPGGRVSVGTGLAVAIPEGLAGLVMPRSGLALKHGVALVNSPGLIDPGYRGEVRVLLLNTDGTTDFHVAAGDRIAQLLLVPIATASPLEADSLDSSVRGPAGFGSSG
jgi:dUTP diphosphatase